MSKYDEVRKLEQKLETLKEQCDKIFEEAKSIAQKRDKMNAKFRETKTEIEELRTERDELNRNVRALKTERTTLKKSLSNRIDDARMLRQKIDGLQDRIPHESMKSLKEQIDEIDWIIQTSPTTMEDEKQLVNRVKELETQLNAHKKLEAVRQKSYKIRAEINTTNTSEREIHEKILTAAEKSQSLHEKMLARIEESKKIKIDADGLHQSYLEASKRAKSLGDEMVVISIRIRELKGAALKETKEKRAASENAIKEQLRNTAREKLEKGEKLTLEEFKMIAGDGNEAED